MNCIGYILRYSWSP